MLEAEGLIVIENVRFTSSFFTYVTTGVFITDVIVICCGSRVNSVLPYFHGCFLSCGFYDCMKFFLLAETTGIEPAYLLFVDELDVVMALFSKMLTGFILSKGIEDV